MKCGDIKEECPRFTTPEFCPVTVLLPESLGTFGFSCYLHTGYDIKLKLIKYILYIGHKL